MSCAKIAEQIREDACKLSYADLVKLAADMGVEVDHEDTREEIIDRMIAAEQYAFTH